MLKQAEYTSTGILKMEIETASAKTRTGGPHDDRADLQDPEVAGKVWTGVVPMYQVLGTPMASDSNKVKQVPEYLSDWVSDPSITLPRIRHQVHADRVPDCRRKLDERAKSYRRSRRAVVLRHVQRVS